MDEQLSADALLYNSILKCNNVDIKTLKVGDLPLFCFKIFSSHNTMITEKQVFSPIIKIEYLKEHLNLAKLFPNCIELDLSKFTETSGTSTNISISHGVSPSYPDKDVSSFYSILKTIRSTLNNDEGFYPFIISLDTSQLGNKHVGDAYYKKIEKIKNIILQVFTGRKDLLMLKHNDTQDFLPNCEQLPLKDLMNKILFRWSKPKYCATLYTRLSKSDNCKLEIYESNITYNRDDSETGSKLSMVFENIDTGKEKNKILTPYLYRVYPSVTGMLISHSKSYNTKILNLNYSQNYLNICAFNFYKVDKNDLEQLKEAFENFYKDNLHKEVNTFLEEQQKQRIQFDIRLLNWFKKLKQKKTSKCIYGTHGYLTLFETALGGYRSKKKRKKRKSKKKKNSKKKKMSKKK